MSFLSSSSPAQPCFIYGPYSPSSAFSATDTKAGLTVDDIRHATEDTWWAPADMVGAKAVTIDHDEAETFDAICIAGEGLAGVTVEIRGSDDDFVSSDVQLSAEAPLSGSIAAYIKLTEQYSYRYLRLIFTGFGSDFCLCHVRARQMILLPFHEKDPDFERVQGIGKHIKTHTGRPCGAVQQYAQRKIPIGFGQITDIEHSTFVSWAEACIQTMRPFFYIPDTAASFCFFGHVEDSYEFSAPRTHGLHKITGIPFITRAA